MVWPLALANIIREGETETIWSRVHARQALVWGVFASATLIAVLALPLIVVVLVPSISTGATIVLYTGGLIADVLVALGLVGVGLRFAARAAKGELFGIPLVTPLVDRIFGIRQR